MQSLTWGLLGLGADGVGLPIGGLRTICPRLPADVTCPFLGLHSASFASVLDLGRIPDVGTLWGAAVQLVLVEPPLLVLPQDQPVPVTNGHRCSRCFAPIELDDSILTAPAGDGYIYRFHRRCAM